MAFSMRTDVIGPDMDVSRNGFLFDRLTGLDMARSIMADVILADSGLAARNSVLLDNPSGVNAARSITRSVIAANGAFFGSSTAGELEPSIMRDAIVPGPIAANRNNIASGRVTVGRARAAGSNTQPVVVRSNAGFD